MKPSHQPIIILIISIFYFSNTFSQKQTPQQKTEASVDTVYDVDTIKIAPDPNSVVLRKSQYDSLMLALKNQKQNQNQTKPDSTTIQKSNNSFNYFNTISLISADYMNVGLRSSINKNNYFLYGYLGYNFNPGKPIIGGIGLSKRLSISEKLFFEPEIASFWYFPINDSYKIENNNHILLGIGYAISKNLNFAIYPSLYCSWKSNLENNIEYNDAIHLISPNNPFYAKETGSKSTFDIGWGISASLEININN